MSIFWERFYDLCSKHDTRPNPVAKEIGISSAIVTKWKAGSLPNGENIIKIADYLGCSVDYLLGRTEEPTGYASPDRLDSELDELYRYIRSLPEEEQQRLTALLWNVLETIKAEAAKEP